MGLDPAPIVNPTLVLSYGNHGPKALFPAVASLSCCHEPNDVRLHRHVSIAPQDPNMLRCDDIAESMTLCVRPCARRCPNHDTKYAEIRRIHQFYQNVVKVNLQFHEQNLLNGLMSSACLNLPNETPLP
jgi:hypothetical protein